MNRKRLLIGFAAVAVVIIGAAGGTIWLGSGGSGGGGTAGHDAFATGDVKGLGVSSPPQPEAARSGGGSEAALPAGGATAPTAAASGAAPGTPPGASGGGLQDVPLDRKIVFSASVSLDVKDVASAFGLVSGVARDSGGFVERSNFANSGGDKSRTTASLTIRVPVKSYQHTLQSIRTIDGAKVSQEGSKSTEVTDQYVDLQSRMRNLQQTEASYLKLMDQARSVQDILTLNDRLSSVRGQIEQIQGRINVLDHMTDLAAIDISLAPIAPTVPEVHGGTRTFGEAFADAWASSLDGLRLVAAGTAVAVVAAIWLVVPLGLVLLGARHLRRRHGNAAAT